MLNPQFGAQIAQGQLNISDKKRWHDTLQKIKPGFYQVILRKPTKNRSNEENSYYWGVVVKLIAEETGADEDSVHEGLKILFLRVKRGKLIYPKSTSRLSTIEFEQYLEKCRVWAAQELGIRIPLPNEAEY